MRKLIHRVSRISVFVPFYYFPFDHFVFCFLFKCSKYISNFSLLLSKCFLLALHQLDSSDESEGCRKPSSWCSPSSQVISNSEQFSKFKIKAFELVWSCCAVMSVVWRPVVINLGGGVSNEPFLTLSHVFS